MPRFALLLSSLLLVATAARAEDAPDRSLAPYFVVQGEGQSFPLERTDVHFDVAGVIAEVTVTQTYQNRGIAPLSAKYVFPASTRAAVHGLTMRLPHEVIHAQIKERAEAKLTYENAKAEGKSASLLEQERPNVFTMNVANVLGGEEVVVELHYTELLVPTAGTYELVFPTVVGPRYGGDDDGFLSRFVKSPYLHAGARPLTAFNISGTLASALPLEALGSPSHAVKVSYRDPKHAEVALEEGEGHEGNRDFILRYRLAGKAVQSGLLLHQGKDENFFLLMVQPPARVTTEMIPPREYVFVVDVSGSMRGFPLDTAKGLLRNLTSALRPQDRFNVLLFSGDSKLMSEGGSVPASTENVNRAMALIDAEAGGGGTELRPALDRALALPSSEGRARSFVVVTDGFISTEKELFEDIHAHLGSASVYCFGIGSSVNRYLVEGVARAGMGESFIVTRPEQGPAEAARFAEYVSHPVLTHVRLHAEGFEISDVEPKAIPDLLADRPLVIQGKWKGPRHGSLTVEGMGGAGPYRSRIEVSGVAPEEENAPLVQLWARTRIADLSDYGQGKENEAKAGEVTRLGLKYSLLTEHTSFIAVSEKVRTATPGEVVEQPLPMPEGMTDSAVGAYAVGAEPELAMLLVAAMAMLGAAALTRRTS